MRKLQGIVSANKMSKTVVVEVHRLRKHAKYLKYYRVSKKFKAHDEQSEYKVGDSVVIEEVRPLSKEKRWRVASLIKRMPAIVEDEDDNALTV